MHASSVTGLETPDLELPHLTVRQGGAAALAQALRDSRRDTLATFAAFEHALPGLQVAEAPQLNPPLWELGHIGWFQNFWIARNPASERRRGWRADPHAPRLEQAPGHPPNADSLYDSTRVAHASRWRLPLPGAQATRDELAQGLQATLDLLRQEAERAAPGEPDDDALYFFRLALLHEDMHHEAAQYMAQALGVPLPVPPSGSRPRALPPPPAALHLEGGAWRSGRPAQAPGFAFDNEVGEQQVLLAPFEIDAQVLRWAEYLPFAEDGGYRHSRWWTPAGWAWCQGRADDADAPRYLRREGRRWWARRHGEWALLDLAEPACHLSAHEARAWCAWAGRRLPTEAEWECAALSRPEAFAWGEVWEWTASPFAPFAGFEPHPYRDYSAPWFDGRPVLRGASFMTQPRMRHPHYRNFFTPERNDLAAGFRSCAA